MKQDNNIAIEVLEAEITACEISRARKIVINENRKAAEMDKEITSLQHSIQTLSSTDKVIGTYFIPNMATSSGDMTIEVPTEYWGIPFELILREVKQ